MQDRIYLLSLEEAFQENQAENLLKMAYERLDRERVRRAEQIKQEKKRIQSVGAGLLLQLAVQEAQKEPGQEMIALTFAELFQRLKKPALLEYTYGKNGKPYFRNFPYYFSLSHSEGYAVCAFSQEEIGADIQQQRPCDVDGLARRFFSEQERIRLEQKSLYQERMQLFYKLWCRKEAYGKLTGEGIAGSVKADLSSEAGKKVRLRDISAPEGYFLTICKWRGERDR